MAKAIVRDGFVQMLDESGSPVEVPESSLAHAYAAGYTPEDPQALATREREEQYGGTGQTALAFAEGVASGLTFGVSDQALVAALGEEYRENAQARAQVNPIARGSGEITGALAPALASGGSSVAARAVLSPGRAVAAAGRGIEAAAGRSLAGRVLGGAASGALEGAAFSAGRANTDAALGNTPLTVEKLLSAAGEGALWGAVGGGVLTGGTAAIGKAGGYAVKRMTGGKTLREALGEYADKTLVRRAAPDIARMSADDISRLSQRMRDAALPLDDAARTTQAAAAKLDEAHAAARRVSKLADAAQVRPDMRRMVATIDEQIAKLERTPLKDFETAASNLKRQVKPLRKALDEGREFSMSEVYDLRSKLRTAAPDSPAGSAVEHLRTQLDETMNRALDKTDDALHANNPTLAQQRRELKDAWRQAQADVDDWTTIANAAKRKPPAEVSQALPGASTMLGVLTGVATGNFGLGALTALAGSRVKDAATQYVLRRGPDVVARIADRLARSDQRISTAAKALVKGESLTFGDRALSLTTEGRTGGIVANAVARLVQQVSDPAEIVRATSEIAAADPDLAASVAQTMAADAAYLRDLLPPTYSRDANTLTLEAAGEPTMSPYAQRKLLRVAEALNSPDAVLENLSHGRLYPEQMQALRDRRPELYAEMRSKVAIYAAEQGTALPFRRRNLLGQAFELPADWSLLPENLQAIQAAVELPPQDSPAPSQSANISDEVSESFALPSNPIGQSI